jgi:hypothetical protein
MNLYMDVGISRIQEYINRTSGSDEHVLRKRRGASTMVAEATDVDALSKALAVHGVIAQRNDETYDTEGVAHLLITDSGGLDETQIADLVLAWMREQVPAAYLEVSWAAGADFAAVLDELRRQRESGNSLVWLPRSRDEALSRRCKSCGMGTADHGSECSDCRTREDKGQRGKSRAEDVLTSALNLKAVKDFGELAKLPGRVDEAAKTNHLATVYADGNGVGALFKQLHDRPQLARELSELLDAATKAATIQAINALPTSGKLPAVASVVAADDIVITVPAAWGWQFALALHAAFDAEIQAGFEAASQDLQELEGRKPSLSSGLVFSHYKSPIEIATIRAATCLRAAKKSVSGEEAVICWTDLTQESESRNWPCRLLSWFAQHRADLDAVAALPGSKRKYYERALAVLANDPQLLVAYLDDDAKRTGKAAAVGAFIDGHDTSQLADALSIADWWS